MSKFLLFVTCCNIVVASWNSFIAEGHLMMAKLGQNMCH
jgi:hypothetical protein